MFLDRHIAAEFFKCYFATILDWGIQHLTFKFNYNLNLILNIPPIQVLLPFGVFLQFFHPCVSHMYKNIHAVHYASIFFPSFWLVFLGERLEQRKSKRNSHAFNIAPVRAVQQVIHQNHKTIVWHTEIPQDAPLYDDVEDILKRPHKNNRLRERLASYPNNMSTPMLN